MLAYPSVWLVDQDAKPLLHMPAGTGTFQTVPEQLEILPLEQWVEPALQVHAQDRGHAGIGGG